MKVILKNNSSDNFSYLNGSIVIPSNGNLEVPSSQWFSLLFDDNFFKDIKLCNLIVNDGVHDLFGSDVNDYLKSILNIAPRSSEVTTQFEKRDKTLKLVSAQADVDINSIATILIKVPGTPNPTGDTSLEGRWISSGTAWFDSPYKDDRILSVKFTDEDNLLGNGAGFIIGSYTDDEVEDLHQGWRIPLVQGLITVQSVGGYGFCPAGFYIKIIAKKGNGITSGTFYTNIEWAEDG